MYLGKTIQNSCLKHLINKSFLDDLGKWLLTAETSTHFLPFMNNFKKNYVSARRSVKKRILRSKEETEI